MKTVFVIGAGASKEANLPTGIELKSIISKILDFDSLTDYEGSGYTAYQSVCILHKDNMPVLRKAKQICEGIVLSKSIDNYINNHKDDPILSEIAKIAITVAILDKESKSTLRFSDKKEGLSFDRLKDSWYIPLYQTLTEGCGLDELEFRFKNVTFVIFNYDRCVEHFLFNALMLHYNINPEKAAKLVRSINICHPYGKVGSLPWEENKSDDDSIEFGGAVDPQQIVNLSRRIKTFTESVDPALGSIEAIRNDLFDADKIIFLGFGFHKINMDILNTSRFPMNHKNCYASTLGISAWDEDIVKERIKNLFMSDKNNTLPIKIYTGSDTCSDFFLKFNLSMSF